MLPSRLAALVRSPRAPALVCLVTGAAALAALLGDSWIGRTVFAYRDMHRVCLPARRYLAERALGGEWPEWYPFDGLGGSFVGEMVTGAFHPTAWLHLILPHVLAFNFSVGLAHAAALAGTTLLLRRWGTGWAAGLCGGLVFSVSGYLVSMDGTLPYLLSAAAIPWALWGVAGEDHAGPRLAVAALALASMVLAGDPQTALTAGGLCVACAAALPRKERRSALLGLAVVSSLAVLVAAVQLLPALSTFSETGLGAHGFTRAQSWSLEPVRLLDLVIPQLFAGPAAPVPVKLLGLGEFQSLWADSLFLGAPALGLALVAVRHSKRRREVWLLLVLAIVGLLVALGSHTPIYELLQRALPPWRAFRYPEKTMVFVTFALAALAGLGAQAALDAPGSRRTLLAGLAACLALTIAAVGVGQGSGSALLWLAGAGEQARAELATVLPAFSAQAFVGLLMALVAFVWSFALRARPAIAALGLVAFVGGTCLVGNRGVSRGYRVEPEIVFAEPRTLSQMRRLEPQLYGKARFYAYDEEQVYREPVKGRDGKARAMVRFDNANLVRGTGALFGVEGLVGYLPLSATGRAERSNELLPDEVYLRSFNARFLLEPDPRAATIDDSFRVREVPGAGARIRLAQAVVVAGEAQMADAVRAPGFDPVSQVVVEAPGFPTTAPTAASLTVNSYAPERVEIEARSETPCALFIADRFAPGWTATLDGAPVPIVPADLVGRAVAMPAGKHQVVMSYRAPGLRTGALLSLLGIAGCLALGLLWKRRPRP